MGVTGLNPVIVSHDLRKTAEPQSLLEGKAVSLDASLIRFAYRYWPKGHPPVPPSPYQTAHALINQILDVQSLQLPPGQTARPPLMLCFEPLVPRHKWENEPRFSDVGTYEDYELAREGKIAAIKQEIVDDGRFKHLTFRHSPGENDETQASLGAQLGHIAISYDSDVLLVSGCVRMVYPKTMTINGVDYPPYGSYVDTQDVLDDLGVTLGQIQLAALCSRAGFDGHKGLFRFSIADPACLKAVGQFNDQNLDLAAALKTIQEELEIVGMKNEFGTEMQSAFQKAWVYQWERSSMWEVFQIFVPRGVMDIIGQLLSAAYEVQDSVPIDEDLVELWNEDKKLILTGLAAYVPVLFDPSITLGEQIRDALSVLPFDDPLLDTLASVLVTRIVPWSESQHPLYRRLTRADHVQISRGERSPLPPFIAHAPPSDPHQRTRSPYIPGMGAKDRAHALHVYSTYELAMEWFDRAREHILSQLSTLEQARAHPVLDQLRTTFATDATVTYEPDPTRWRLETPEERAERIAAENKARDSRVETRKEVRDQEGEKCSVCAERFNSPVDSRPGPDRTRVCLSCVGKSHPTGQPADRYGHCTDCDCILSNSVKPVAGRCQKCRLSRHTKGRRRLIAEFSPKANRPDADLTARARRRGLRDDMTDEEWAATVKECKERGE